MARQGKTAQATAPPGRKDYLPDSRIMTPSDKLERDALFVAFGANLHRARTSAGMTQRNSPSERILPKRESRSWRLALGHQISSS